jgi:hypothetical protein
LDDDSDQVSLVYSGTVSDCTPESFGGNVTDLSILDCTTDHTGLRFGSVVAWLVAMAFFWYSRLSSVVRRAESD